MPGIVRRTVTGEVINYGGLFMNKNILFLILFLITVATNVFSMDWYQERLSLEEEDRQNKIIIYSKNHGLICIEAIKMVYKLNNYVGDLPEGYIHGKYSNDNTSLHYAAYISSNVLIERLIKSGADVNAKNKFGCTPTDFVVRKDAEELLRNLYGLKSEELEMSERRVEREDGGKRPRR